MANLDTVDWDWTWDGDIYVGDDGDIADTRDDQLRSLENEVQTIVKSEFSDWLEHTILGANLSDFLGEPNTRQTGEKIRERVVSRIIAMQIVSPEDIDAKVIPVGSHQVLIMIAINVASTPYNRLEPGTPLVSSFIYDTLESSVFYLPPNQVELDFRRK